VQFINGVVKSGVVEKILNWAKFKQESVLAKATGGQKVRRRLPRIKHHAAMHVLTIFLPIGCSLWTHDALQKSRLSGIPKLDDANMAGTKDSRKCTLILTEGDSAKALAVRCGARPRASLRLLWTPAMPYRLL
jgi:DNA topoisomerase-2